MRTLTSKNFSLVFCSFDIFKLTLFNLRNKSLITEYSICDLGGVKNLV